MHRITREDLFRLLDQRLDNPSIASEQDEAIWEQCGVERAILVMDLSGFTKSTRIHGILHFLAVFRRATSLVFPVIKANQGRVVKCEADNVMACFESAKDAVVCAVEMVSATQSANANLAEHERVFPCIGIGYGKILELDDDFFGDEVNVAFKLGEDLAAAQEILVTESARTKAASEGLVMRGEDRSTELGGVTIPHLSVTGIAS